MAVEERQKEREKLLLTLRSKEFSLGDFLQKMRKIEAISQQLIETALVWEVASHNHPSVLEAIGNWPDAEHTSYGVDGIMTLEKRIESHGIEVAFQDFRSEPIVAYNLLLHVQSVAVNSTPGLLNLKGMKGVDLNDGWPDRLATQLAQL